MNLIVARPPAEAEPTDAERRMQVAEALLQAALASLVAANRGMEREIRLAAKHGLSQRRIFELTGVNRRRIQRIIDTTEG